MYEYEIEKLAARLSGATSGLAGWRRLRAAKRLAAATNSPRGMEALARALVRCPDQRIVVVAQAALAEVTYPPAIDAICAIWLEARTPALDALLTERRWVASQPATLRVATALHNGNLGPLANGDPELARALVDAAEQDRCPERQRALEALVALRQPATREAVCRLAIEGGRPAALEAALTGNFAASDPERRALLLFLGGEFERYAELDFDGSLLRAAHKAAGKKLRRRLAERARAAGRVEWVRAVTGGRRGRRLGKLSDIEWETAISVLVAAERWEELWRLALEAPAVWCARMLRELGQHGFTPAEEQERVECAALIELAGTCMAEPALILKGNQGRLKYLAAIPDGGLLAIDDSNTTVRLWRLPSGEPAGTLEDYPSPVSCLAVSPCGTLLASGYSDGTTRLWRLPSGLCTSILEYPEDTVFGHNGFSCLAFTPDGGQLIGGTSRRQVQQDTGRKIAEPVGVGYTQGAPDGYWYTIYEHRTVWENRTVWKIPLWKLPSGKLADTLSVDGPVECLTVTPDGRLIVGVVSRYSGSSNSPGDKPSAHSTVQLWRLPSGIRDGTLNGHTDKIRCLAVTPDSALLASGTADGTIRLWQLPSGELRHTLKGHTGEVSCLAVSPDGRFLASGSIKEAIVRIWQLPSGKPADTLKGHSGGILSLAFSPDGALLASGGLDKTIRLWPWTLRVVFHRPLGEVSLTQVKDLRQAYDERPAGERAWIELITALVHRRHRHDIELVEVPHTAEPDNSDIELDD